MHSKHALRTEARRLRQQGLSVGQIAEQLGVAKSSVSYWVRDIALTDEQIERLQENKRNNKGRLKGAQTNKRLARDLRVLYQNEGRAKARERSPLHLAGCMLYWAEGAKDATDLYFANADFNMHRMFMRFLLEELSIPLEDITLRVFCHSDDDDEKRRVEHYWLTILDLPPSSLRKTVYKPGSEKSHKTLQNGICSIRVNKSMRYLHHIYGAIQEYGGFENKDWLF